MNELKNLLEGFFDTHVHAGPGLMPREIDAWELVQHAGEHHFSGVVIKDHHVPSMGLARIIEDHYPSGSIRVLGSLALNNTVGGLNAQAVETAIHFGAKIIWLPTTSALHHHKMHKAAGFPKPKSTPKVADIPIECLNANGRLAPSLQEVLSVLAEHREVILATGHLSPAEVNAVVHRAKGLRIHRIIVTHPFFMVDAELVDVKNWAKLGAYLEFTAINSFPESILYTLPPAKIAHVIKAIGPDRIILSSDAGLKDNGWPFGNVLRLLELLRAEGIADRDLRKLVVDNPTNALGISSA
jgi:hypothetical protein